jgi:ribosomal protein L10
MAVKKKSEKRIKKENYWKKLWEFSETYKKALLVDVDNVSSKQLNKIRLELRPYNAHMLMGKNVSYLTRINDRKLDSHESCFSSQNEGT